MAGCGMQSHSGRSIGNVDLLFTDFNLSFADYKKNQCLQETNDVADPWYTGDFEATYRDIVAGCEGFLEYLGYR